MSNPLLRDVMPFAGIDVIVVEAGTKIIDDRTGEEVVVDDKTAAGTHDKLYVTKTVWDALKAQIPQSI